MQSPINLTPRFCTIGEHLEPVRTFGYDKAKLDKNTMNTDFSNKAIDFNLGIHGGGLSGFYRLNNIHFHSPAEHRLNGQSMAGEIHFVHYLGNLHSLSEALTVNEGVSVIGVFLEPKHDELTPDPVTEVLLGSRPVQELIPVDSDYFRYKGSLTTGNCTEHIIWTVYTTPISISSLGIDLLKRKASGNRPVQPLNNRTVLLYQGFGLNKIITTDINFSISHSPNWTVLLILLFLAKKLL